MHYRIPFEHLADAVLILHFSIVMFVVGGLLLIVVGNGLGWSWVNRLWFRALHLTAIGVVVGESWFGMTCPLTTLESWLRTQAGMGSYTVSFIERWLQWVMFFDAPGWMFTLVYTLFGGLVAWVWWRFPPARRK